MIASGKVDSVGSYIERLGLRGDAGLVNSFVGALVARRQFSSAFEQAAALVGVRGRLGEAGGRGGLAAEAAGVGADEVMWDLGELVQVLVGRSMFGEALKYVERYKLQDLFPPAELIEKMITQKEHLKAFRIARKLNMPVEQYGEDAFYGRMVRDNQWADILSLCESVASVAAKHPISAVVCQAVDCGAFTAAAGIYEDRKIFAKENAARAKLAAAAANFRTSW